MIISMIIDVIRYHYTHCMHTAMSCYAMLHYATLCDGDSVRQTLRPNNDVMLCYVILCYITVSHVML